MLTINIYLKLALIVLFLGGGIVLWSIYGFWYSFIFLLIGLLLLASYFLLGTVQSASTLMQDGDFQGADKRLNMTVLPKWLYVTNRAIYKILKGTIASQTGDNKTAEGYFNEALAMDLPTDNEKGMVLLQLANIQANKNNFTGAKNYFSQAKKLKITEPQIKEQLDLMDKAFSQSQASRRASQGMGGRRGGMMQPGGKRRRPKMR